MICHCIHRSLLHTLGEGIIQAQVSCGVISEFCLPNSYPTRFSPFSSIIFLIFTIFIVIVYLSVRKYKPLSHRDFNVFFIFFFTHVPQDLRYSSKKINNRWINKELWKCFISIQRYLEKMIYWDKDRGSLYVSQEAII